MAGKIFQLCVYCLIIFIVNIERQSNNKVSNSRGVDYVLIKQRNLVLLCSEQAVKT